MADDSGDKTVEEVWDRRILEGAFGGESARGCCAESAGECRGKPAAERDGKSAAGYDGSCSQEDVIEDWSRRLEVPHAMQEEARQQGKIIDGVLPSGLPACPVATTLSLIGNRWTPLIIRELLSGTKRFGQLQRALGGVSQKVLTSNLRTMEEAGLVARTVYPEVPPRVEYALTPTGFSLEPVIDSMWRWGKDYQSKRASC